MFAKILELSYDFSINPNSEETDTLLECLGNACVTNEISNISI